MKLVFLLHTCCWWSYEIRGCTRVYVLILLFGGIYPFNKHHRVDVVVLGAFRKACGKRAEFVFFDAPHLVPAKKNEDSTVEPGTPDENAEERGWWFSAQVRSGRIFFLRQSELQLMDARSLQ